MKEKKISKKKSYRAPKLVEYGDVYRLTQANKGANANDGGGAKPNSKAPTGSGS